MSSTTTQTASGVINLAPASHEIHTKLNYSVLPTNGERPYNYITPPSDPSIPRSNLGVNYKDAVIRDIRDREPRDTGLDISGFDWVKHQTEMKYDDWADDAIIEKKYYPETIDLVKKVTGAHTVAVFDHTVRRLPPHGTTVPDTPSTRQPVSRVHVDQTPESATNRVRRHMPPEDVESLLNGRYRLINVWRPFFEVFDAPLAVADWRSLDMEKDLHPSALIYPDREGETFIVSYNPDHSFWSLSHQQKDEVLFIKCYDNKPGVAALTPHTAFQDSQYYGKEGVRPRESVELRCLVFQEE